MKKVICCFLFILFLPVSISSAGELAYTCEITHVYNLEDDGFLTATNAWEKHFVGSKFSVSRVTGEIIGEVLTTVAATSTKVINKGNKDYFFTSIAHFENQAQLIEIQEFIKGDKKPFVAMSLGGAGIVAR